MGEGIQGFGQTQNCHDMKMGPYTSDTKKGFSNYGDIYNDCINLLLDMISGNCTSQEIADCACWYWMYHLQNCQYRANATSKNNNTQKDEIATYANSHGAYGCPPGLWNRIYDGTLSPLAYCQNLASTFVVVCNEMGLMSSGQAVQGVGKK